MKIIDKREPKRVAFGELSNGYVFCSLAGEFYIKTERKGYNAVHLCSGDTVSFGICDLVIKEKATLIIGGDEDENC